MKRVVLIRSNPVNPDPPVEKAADTLLKNGFQVTVVCWDRASSEKESRASLKLQHGTALKISFGIPAEFGGGLKKNIRALSVFEKRLSSWLGAHREEYDIIHAFDFDTGFTASHIAKKYHKKFVYHILDFYIDSHRIPTDFLKNKIKNAEFKVIAQADCIILCTEKRKEQIQGSSPRSLQIIHNTPKMPEGEIGRIPGIEKSDRCRIVYVGVLAGSRFLLEIVDLVIADPRLELHIGGFGPYEEKIRQVAEQCSRITYYGKIPYQQTLALENSCDIMFAIYDPAYQNNRYAAPNKFYESLMLGKPIIMAKNTGFDDIILENQIGEVIDFSRQGLAEGFQRILAKRSQWQAMGQRMKALYHSAYSWDEMEKRLLDIYRKF